MYREIILPRDVRLFQKTKPHGKQLMRIEAHLKAGEVLTVSEPETVVYDHRDQKAVAFEYAHQTYYMLVSEIKIPELEDPEDAEILPEP